MTIATTLMGLLKGTDADNAETYLTGPLATTLDKLDAQNHDGAAGGAAVAKLAVTQASTVTGVTISGASAGLDNFSLTHSSFDATNGIPVVWNKQVLGGSAVSLVTPAIPGTWSQIEIVGQLRSDYAPGGSQFDTIGVYFNSDTTVGHYDGGYLYSDTTTAAKATGTSNQRWAIIGPCACNNGLWSGFGSFSLVIPSYANAAYGKNFHANGSAGQFGTAGNVAIPWNGAGQWNQTAAITTVTLFPINGANWVAGTMWTVTLVP